MDKWSKLFDAKIDRLVPKKWSQGAKNLCLGCLWDRFANVLGQILMYVLWLILLIRQGGFSLGNISKNTLSGSVQAHVGKSSLQSGVR